MAFSVFEAMVTDTEKTVKRAESANSLRLQSGYQCRTEVLALGINVSPLV
jgi:hypothetical protein